MADWLGLLSMVFFVLMLIPGLWLACAWDEKHHPKPPPHRDLLSQIVQNWEAFR